MRTQDRSTLPGHRWSRILSLDTLNTLMPVSRQYASSRIICRWLAESMSASNGTRQMTPWLLSHCLDARARNVGSMPHVIVPLGQPDISFCPVHDRLPLKIKLEINLPRSKLHSRQIFHSRRRGNLQRDVSNRRVILTRRKFGKSANFFNLIESCNAFCCDALNARQTSHARSCERWVFVLPVGHRSWCILQALATRHIRGYLLLIAFRSAFPRHDSLAHFTERWNFFVFDRQFTTRNGHTSANPPISFDRAFAIDLVSSLEWFLQDLFRLWTCSSTHSLLVQSYAITAKDFHDHSLGREVTRTSARHCVKIRAASNLISRHAPLLYRRCFPPPSLPRRSSIVLYIRGYSR